MIYIMSPSLYQAAVFDNDVSQSLLEKTNEEHLPQHEQLNDNDDDDVVENNQLLQYSFVGFGVVVGWFMQLSTLGMNYLLSQQYGDDYLNNHQNHQLATNKFVCSILWSFYISIIAVMCFETIKYMSTTSTTTSNSKSNNSNNTGMFDTYFLSGCIVGVCSLWFIIQSMLNVQLHFVYFITSLFVTLFSFRGLETYVINTQRPLTSALAEDEVEEDLHIV